MQRPSTINSALLALVLAAGSALAQIETDPDEALVPTSEQEDVILRPTEGGDTSAPGLDLPDPRPGQGTELPEGTLITGAQGIVVPLTSGGWAFVFDQDTEGKADPPMVLQPSMQTAQMLRLVGAREDTMTLRIAGEVQRYLGRHYLLPYRFDVVASGDGVEQKPADERAAEAEETLTRGGDETADELAARVDRAAEEQRRRSIPNATTPGENATDATPIATEGTLVIDVSGRIERDTSGLWVFTSDNDADSTGQETLEGAVTLVPCLMLQAMERDLSVSSARTRLSISGRVLVFEGANYLLPTLYRLTPDTGGNLTSAQ